MLCVKLKPAIGCKGRGILSKGLLFYNARPHTAGYTVETTEKLNFEDLEHPPYSPGLALPNVLYDVH